MFSWIDGLPVVFDFEQVEQLYYQAFIEEFKEDLGELSITQWRGSYEYQALYPAIQLTLENGAIVQSSLESAMQSIADVNEELKLPAVLHSRVAERFAESGYIATIRVATEETRGIVAICVDYPFFDVERAMNVGHDDDGLYGYSPSMGSLDNAIFDGLTISSFLTTSDYSLPTAIFTETNENFPNYPDEMQVNIAGYGQVSFSWNESSNSYELAENDLNDFIVSKDGEDLVFIIENEVDTDKTQDLEIASIIAFETLPAGQWMEGNVSEGVTISNGQNVLTKWSTPFVSDLEFKITLTVDKNSQHPVAPVDEIVDSFITNFNDMNKLGNDITPESYFQIAKDAPWASKIDTVYSLNGGADTADIYYASYRDKFNANLSPVNVTILTV